MADVQYSWPTREQARLIGKRIPRIDGFQKNTGSAKYTYDVNLKDQLIVKSLDCPHAHCRIKSLDTSEAAKMPGVAHVYVYPHAQPGQEIQWQGELLVSIAAESEAAANAAIDKIKVDYELLDVFTKEDDLEAARTAGRTLRDSVRTTTEREPGDDDDEDEFVEAELKRLFEAADHVVEGEYGISAITHCCLEPHGATVQWDPTTQKLKAYLSTQNVSRTDEQFANALGIAEGDVDVECQYIGGGFGSKFQANYWGLAAAEISKATGRPVKFMLDRDQELKIGGNRPSGYIRAKIGADRDGMVTVWDSHQWGSSGYRGGGVSDTVMPYVLQPKNRRTVTTPIRINAMQAVAWRAPNHPQACVLTQCLFDDLAAAMGVNSLDIFMKNIDNLASRQTPDVYREEMKIAARLMDWETKWHPHGKGPRRGSVVEGLGMAVHEWGGVANDSTCQLKINPDGSVESFCGTQDLGTGTRTVCAMVLAETFGLNVDEVRVNIGRSAYPFSGASGGSTTVGAVCESHRQAAQNALPKLLAAVAPKLETSADNLEVGDHRIQVKGQPDKSLSWKEACQSLGVKPLEASATHTRGPGPLSSEGVGGVQMAHVAVDTETGQVQVRKFVAVQDIGLVVNRELAESQVHGAVIMGIAYALFEERILDPGTGAFLNSEMADYKLPRLGDIGEIVVEFYEPDDQRKRGVIGLGEPPVISPGAAISNAVCNALGVRVPVLPMTPQRVVEAIQKSGRNV